MEGLECQKGSLYQFSNNIFAPANTNEQGRLLLALPGSYL